jgi:hypothetical protein
MNLGPLFAEHVRACFAGIWIESHEHADALDELTVVCRSESWTLATWDVAAGLACPGFSSAESVGPDPVAAIRALGNMAAPDGTAVLVLANFHRFLQSAELVQAMARQIVAGKQSRTILVVLAPLVSIPPELEKLFVVLTHELPDRSQLEAIARGVATEPGDLPEGDYLERVLDAAAGLTRLEAENAFSLSLVRHGRIEVDTVWAAKTQGLRKSGLLSLYCSENDFRRLGGLESLKSFCRRALAGRSRHDANKRPRGVMLLSPPGCGKSQFCKALGREVGRPVIVLDVGSLMGSLVGQSEQRTRQALQTIDAMAPCVVMIDEVEKAFAGLGSQGDSGVAARMFGTFLTWLNDHESDVFVVCTANDVSKLPPEFARSERFDAVFFLDLPVRAEKDAIWAIYCNQFGIPVAEPRPDDSDWTGAEIRACCRLAALLETTLVDAATNVVPVAVTAAESIARLRSWADGRCLSAHVPGLYRQARASDKPRRRVTQDPSAN